MSTSEDHVLTISNLAPDVIRTIIRFGQEDIDIMNQISPQWSAIARAHLKIKTNLPVVNYFCWNTNEDEQTKLAIRIPERFRKYFNVEHWHIRARFNNSSLIELVSDALSTYTVPFEMNINRIFDRSSRIARFDIELDIMLRNSENKILKNTLIGQVIDTLVFKENLNTKKTQHRIKDLMGTVEVKRLVFTNHILFSADFEAIFPSLCSILSLVKGIELSSRDFDDEALATARVVQQPQMAQQQIIPQIARPKTIPRMDVNFFRKMMQMPNQPVRQIAQPQPIRKRINHHQAQRMMQNMNLCLAQIQTDDQKRAEWRKFNDLLNGTEKVSATFHEDIRPNERTRFSITIVALE